MKRLTILCLILVGVSVMNLASRYADYKENKMLLAQKILAEQETQDLRRLIQSCKTMTVFWPWDTLDSAISRLPDDGGCVYFSKSVPDYLLHSTSEGMGNIGETRVLHKEK